MSDPISLSIEFIDLKKFYKGKEQCHTSNIHYAHLYVNTDNIELKICLDDDPFLYVIIATWLYKLDFSKFGENIKINLINNNLDDNLLKIDFSDAKLLKIEHSDNILTFSIDTVKFYWNPNKEKVNTAEFYLDDKGFRIVEPFYSILTPKTWLKNDGNFNIGRIDNSNKFYKLGKSAFRPEFNLVAKDNRNDRVATITKGPKIQFKYQKGITEDNAIFYGDVVLMLASFYHHIKIDYILREIHLPESTITIKNVEKKNFLDRKGNLRGFGINGGLKKFFELSWQKETLKNFELLSKAITLFNQSHLVDNSSAFLIRYNIIEICDKQKQSTEKFTTILTKKQRKVKQGEALIKLLETIKEEEHEEFKKRWCNVQSLLQNKPMKNQLVSFLESQNLDPKTFPVNIKDLKELRDNITHGSIDKIDAEQLRKANILLYRISGILILNLMGIKDWKLDTDIK